MVRSSAKPMMFSPFLATTLLARPFPTTIYIESPSTGSLGSVTVVLDKFASMYLVPLVAETVALDNNTVVKPDPSLI